MDVQPQVLFDDKGHKVRLEGVPMPRYLDGCRVDIISGVVRSYAVVYEDAVSDEVRTNVEELCKLSDRAKGLGALDIISWPVKPLYADKDKQNLVGYILRKLPVTGMPFDVVFLNPQRYGSRIAIDRRIRVLESLCAVVDAVHSLGRVMGRMDDRLLVMSDDKDVVGILHFDWLGTSLVEARAAYLAPEAVATSLPSSSLTREADRYALAIIIYRMLVNGALPAYGTSGEEQTLSSPIPASFPDYLTEAFRRAFVVGEQHPDARPTAEEWSQVLSRYAKDVRQCTMCGAHWFWRWRVACPYCVEEAAARTTRQSPSGPEGASGDVTGAPTVLPEPLAHPMREALDSLECSAGQIISIEGERYQVLGSCRLRKDWSTDKGEHLFLNTDVGATWSILYLSRLGTDGADAGKDAKHDDAWLLVDSKHGVCEILFHSKMRWGSMFGPVDEGCLHIVETDGWQRKGMRKYDLFERGAAPDGSTTLYLIEKKRQYVGVGDEAHWETVKIYTHFSGHRLDVAAIQMEARLQAEPAPVGASRDAGGGTGDAKAGSPTKKALPIVCGLAACAIALLLALGNGGISGVSDFLFTTYEGPTPSHRSSFDTLYSSWDSFPYEKPAVPPYGACTYDVYGDVDEVVDWALESIGDDVQAIAKDDESGAVGILTEKKYVFVYPNAGADGDEAGDSDFTREDAERLLGSTGDMYEVRGGNSGRIRTLILCCDRMQAYRTDLRPYNASWRAYYWYRVFYRTKGWAQDSDGTSVASSYENYTGPVGVTD